MPEIVFCVCIQYRTSLCTSDVSAANNKGDGNNRHLAWNPGLSDSGYSDCTVTFTATRWRGNLIITKGKLKSDPDKPNQTTWPDISMLRILFHLPSWDCDFDLLMGGIRFQVFPVSVGTRWSLWCILYALASVSSDQRVRCPNWKLQLPRLLWLSVHIIGDCPSPTPPKLLYQTLSLIGFIPRLGRPLKGR